MKKDMNGEKTQIIEWGCDSKNRWYSWNPKISGWWFIIPTPTLLGCWGPPWKGLVTSWIFAVLCLFAMPLFVFETVCVGVGLYTWRSNTAEHLHALRIFAESTGLPWKAFSCCLIVDRVVNLYFLWCFFFVRQLKTSQETQQTQLKVYILMTYIYTISVLLYCI